ncbi:Coenzyme F420 hydrogenase/dehydrogenase, beta subunit C-terminal domain [Candidatus Omnitrophota bacterium]
MPLPFNQCAMKGSGKNNISMVVTEKLCMGCGFCESLCPEQCSAIEVLYNQKEGQYFPLVDNEKCSECGVCLKICPGAEIDFNSLNLSFFDSLPFNNYLGNFRSIYTGYAADTAMRKGGSSGGLVTQLMSYALEKNEVEAVMTVCHNSTNAFEPSVIFARSKAELLNCQQSQYLPVPLGVGLKKILKDDIRIGVVGLPCHLHALRKSQVVFKDLNEKIVYAFGLFCFGTTRKTGTEYFLNAHGIIPCEVDSIRFRDGSYPGRIKIVLKNGKTLFLKRWHGIKKSKVIARLRLGIAFGNPFYMRRCFSCVDGTSELADISFGDPWLREFMNEQEGQTLIVSRTRNAQRLIERAVSEGKVILSPLDVKKVILSQGKGECILTAKDMTTKFSIMCAFGRSSPRYTFNRLNEKFSFLRAARYFLSLVESEVSFNRRWRFLLLPLTVLHYSITFIARCAQRFLKR